MEVLNSSTTSNSSNNSCELLPVTREQTNLRLAMPIVFTFFALTNNLLVVFLVFFTKELRKNINFYILNLAISDIVTAMVLCFKYVVLFLYNSHGVLALNGIRCQFLNFFKRVSPIVSLLTLLVISIDRYRAVSSPLNVTNLSKTCFVSLVLLTWIVPGILNIYTAILLKHSRGAGVCDNMFMYYPGVLTYNIFISSFPALVFFLVVSVNIKILKILRQSTANFLSGLNSIDREKRTKKFKSAVQIVLCSLILNVLCSSPSYIYGAFGRHILNTINENGCIDRVALNAVFYNLLIANSALSPLVYFIFLKDFREALKRRLLCSLVVGARQVTQREPPNQIAREVHYSNPVFLKDGDCGSQNAV